MISKLSTLLVILCFCTIRNYGGSRVMATASPGEEDLGLEREFQSLNKPPVKTILLENGDVIDCIDINSQPALDTPLLMNHKIQLRPTSFPLETQNSVPWSNPIFETLSKMEACPDGTIPIHRITKDDLIRARNLSHHMLHNIGVANALAPNTRQVFLRLDLQEDFVYSGVVGSSSVYKLALSSPDWSSTANVWVQGLYGGLKTYLVAGWMVSRSINGDDNPRLFVYWQTDGGAGCFDLLCQGFVQIDQRAAPKTELHPVSQYGGDTYDVRISIYQDPVSGNWWLMVLNITVGYWPKEIVPSLADGAGWLGWGGIAMAGEKEDSPPMGSGHFPDGFYDHAAYFRDIRYMVRGGGIKQIVPTDSDPIDEQVDGSGCYGIHNDKDTYLEIWRYRFLFGGPGGSCKN